MAEPETTVLVAPGQTRDFDSPLSDAAPHSLWIAIGQLAQISEARGVQTFGAHRSHTPDRAHGKLGQERTHVVAMHFEQPVGLCGGARDLGNHLHRPNSDRNLQLRFFQNPCTQASSDLARRSEQPLCARQIEERFVERKTLDPRPERVYFFKGLVAVPTADDVQQVRTADRLGLWTVRCDEGRNRASKSRKRGAPKNIASRG